MYSRIVGGYHPKERPWMALIEMKSKRPRKRPRRPYARKKNSQCGGAIINKVSTYYVKSGVSFERIEYSSKFQSLCSMKCSSETLQNLLYFMYKKTHVVFFVFHFVQLYIFTL